MSKGGAALPTYNLNLAAPEPESNYTSNANLSSHNSPNVSRYQTKRSINVSSMKKSSPLIGTTPVGEINSSSRYKSSFKLTEANRSTRSHNTLSQNTSLPSSTFYQ